MSIELYWGSGSTPAWRTLLGLAVKGVPYTSHLLSFSNRETRTPEFLAMNPRGKVPVLKDGDFVLNESLAILAYLEARFPSPPLFGKNARETGEIWRQVMEFESHGGPAISAVARPFLFNTLAADSEKVKEGLPLVVAELDGLAERVKGGVMVGDSLSAADLVWFCGLQQLVRAATRPSAEGFGLGVFPLGERWPALLPWAGKIEGLPGYDETFPPHWRDGEYPAPSRLK